MVLLVCTGAVLSAAGIYKPLVDYAGAGASVPLIGFGHVLWEGMKKPLRRTDSWGFLPAALQPALPAFLLRLSSPIWPASSSGLK